MIYSSVEVLDIKNKNSYDINSVNVNEILKSSIYNILCI